MHVADTLSQTFVSEQPDDPAEDLFEERVVHTMEAIDALDSDMLKTLKEATAADEVLQAVVVTHRNGWPERRRSVGSPPILAYTTYHQHQEWSTDGWRQDRDSSSC